MGQIFSNAIDGEWEPTNVGLDDVVKGVCAWGAKTVKASRPFVQPSVRLIVGRNNPEYSYGEIADTNAGIGRQVLDIWNARVDAVRERFGHTRTVVLLKVNNLVEFAVFEMETRRYPPDLYEWRRNKNNNLEGFEQHTGVHRFTWQRHGSQFTILEQIPEERVKFRIQHPPRPYVEAVLQQVGFDPSWVQVVG